MLVVDACLLDFPPVLVHWTQGIIVTAANHRGTECGSGLYEGRETVA